MRAHESMDLHFDRPHPARIYSYWLGGKDHFKVDRDAGDALAEALPSIPLAARANRGFMVRVAKYLAVDLGIRQFLDIGTGLPVKPNLHEAAQAIAPAARVVYCDNDPLVLVHARALLTSTPEGSTAYLDADLREPAGIIEQAQKKIMSLSSRPGWMKLAGSVARRRRSRLARSSPSKRMTLGPVR